MVMNGCGWEVMLMTGSEWEWMRVSVSECYVTSFHFLKNDFINQNVFLLVSADT